MELLRCDTGGSMGFSYVGVVSWIDNPSLQFDWLQSVENHTVATSQARDNNIEKFCSSTRVDINFD